MSKFDPHSHPSRRSSTQAAASNATPADSNTRREFLRSSSAVVAGGVLAGTLAAPRNVHAAGSDVIKVGLVGMGGRGTGAAANACDADANVKITALADLFQDQIDARLPGMAAQLKGQFEVPDGQAFAGFDAYQSLMQTDVDVVILATPPHFRPLHLRAAIDAGKHVFCEKPVAVDGPGVRHVYETVRMARDKDLSIVSGLCWRYDYGARETIQRIQEGAIGDIVAIQENYLTGLLSHRLRQPGWSEMEYQCRNWQYFTWASGDHIVEQHVHSLDKALWLMGDQVPESCVGLGGREVRTGEEFGNIFDHHAVYFEYPNGVKVFAFTRQMDGCLIDVEDYVLGTKGRAEILNFKIHGENAWQRDRKLKKPSMYLVEHEELMQGIRNGNHINNGDYMTGSTLMAIMGREACYTGKTITQEAMLNSQTDLSPTPYEFGEIPVPEVPVPGVTTLT
jgi:predicted dehydrogenase